MLAPGVVSYQPLMLVMHVAIACSVPASAAALKVLNCVAGPHFARDAKTAGCGWPHGTLAPRQNLMRPLNRPFVATAIGSYAWLPWSSPT